MRLASLLLVVGVACGEGTIVEIAPVPAEYTDWFSIESVGPVPGHGDTHRVIYANDKARLRGQTVRDPTPANPDRIVRYDTYPEDTIIVKEIYERDGDQPGALKYIGVMRLLDEAPSGAELHRLSGGNGWLFTYLADDINSDEEYRASCWDECHVAAPIDGTFYDYGQ